jgi:hypothetical protein
MNFERKRYRVDPQYPAGHPELVSGSPLIWRGSRNKFGMTRGGWLQGSLSEKLIDHILTKQKKVKNHLFERVIPDL